MEQEYFWSEDVGECRQGVCLYREDKCFGREGVFMIREAANARREDGNFPRFGIVVSAETYKRLRGDLKRSARGLFTVCVETTALSGQK